MTTSLSSVSLASNCEACGEEYPKSKLANIRLSIFSCGLQLCEKCRQSETLESYKDVIKILNK